MAILVTGGAGVIGSYLVRELVARGERPVVFDLQADSSFRREFDNKSDFYQGDIGELAPLVDLCQRHGVTVIAHLAALTGSKALEQPMSQYRVNMHGTMNLLEAARLTGVRRFVMASTRTVYPSFEGTVHGHPSYAPVPEDHWTEPNRPYEVWKHASERIGSYYQEQYGLEFCAFRFGIYLAAERAAAAEAGVGGQRPMGKLHAIIHNAVKSRATTLPQGGDRLLDLVYVRDIAQAFVAAIDAPAIPETVYNIGGGSPVTLETFIGALETVIPGTDIECGPGIDFAPGHYCVLDISRAERDLGYSPAWSLEALLQDCVARARNLLDTR